MSASPAGPSPSGLSDGRTPTSVNGQPRFIRRPQTADPLGKNRRNLTRTKGGPKTVLASRKPNGDGLTALNHSKPGQAYVSKSSQILLNGPPQAVRDFPEAPPGYTDFPLVTSKRALREGIRYHIARFQSKRPVDLTNQDEFIRPVSLHRRDPRQLPGGKVVKEEGPVEVVDEKERERQEILRAEKEAQKAADLAQIAPSGNNAAAMATRRNAAPRNEKTTQVFKINKTEADQKLSELRYEEALPWHIEDAENKQTWVGNYEANLSDTNVILVVEDGAFKMTPLEKWYKFTPKNQFKALTIEEAEAHMGKKAKPTRWVMQDEVKQENNRAQQATRQTLGNVYKVKTESASFKAAGKRETEDADDIDFEGDLFQDDDEQVTVEPDNDEDVKRDQDKIKKEQLGANLFGDANELEIEKEFEKEEKEETMRKKLGKDTKKRLKKREKNLLYESDSSGRGSDGGYLTTSGSDSDTSDDEKQKEEDRRKDEEAKLKARNASKLASGPSSKGTSTPLGRPKNNDPLKKSNHLKRPGSPNLSASETSGNESSRKKHKKKHGSSQPTPSSSRPMSPAPSASQPEPSPTRHSLVKLSVGNNKHSDLGASQVSAMSDGEATEMSDGGRPRNKKLKIKFGGTPGGSRAGSPAGSRAGTPVGTPRAGNGAGPITAEEIIAAVPPGGITTGNLLKLFRDRAEGDAKHQFIMTVKDVCTMGPNKLLKVKGAAKVA